MCGAFPVLLKGLNFHSGFVVVPRWYILGFLYVLLCIRDAKMVSSCLVWKVDGEDVCYFKCRLNPLNIIFLVECIVSL